MCFCEPIMTRKKVKVNVKYVMFIAYLTRLQTSDGTSMV